MNKSNTQKCLKGTHADSLTRIRSKIADCSDISVDTMLLHVHKADIKILTSPSPPVQLLRMNTERSNFQSVTALNSNRRLSAAAQR